MREIKFRAWDKKQQKFVDDEQIKKNFNQYYKQPNSVIMQFTGLHDKNGWEVYEGDIVKFSYDNSIHQIHQGCEWISAIKFEDGVFTVDILHKKQNKNPDKWDQKHDWIESRWWSTKVGYGEYGRWNCPRVPLTEMDTLFESYEKYKKAEEKCNKYPERVINVEVIGNIYENPELLKKEAW